MDYSKEMREEMAKSGMAMADGSYPIKTGADLKNAVQAFGRSPDAATKGHIMKRARAMKMMDMLPADWEGSTREEGETRAEAAQKETGAGIVEKGEQPQGVRVKGAFEFGSEFFAFTRGTPLGAMEKAGRYDESKHPRKPKGDPKGGKFTEKPGGGQKKEQMGSAMITPGLMGELAARGENLDRRVADARAAVDKYRRADGTFPDFLGALTEENISLDGTDTAYADYEGAIAASYNLVLALRTARRRMFED